MQLVILVVAHRLLTLTLGNVVTATQTDTANTYTFANPSASGNACSFTLILTNGGSTVELLIGPSSVDWAEEQNQH